MKSILSLVYRQSVGCSETGHEIESYACEYQKEEKRDNYGKPGDQGIISRMIDAEGLQHAPKTVAEMNEKSSESKDVEECIKKVAQ